MVNDTDEDFSPKLDSIRFWTELYPEITIPKELMNELIDYHFIMKQVGKVYYHITGGRMSKINYFADTVISVADDHQSEEIEECMKCEMEMILDELGIDYDRDDKDIDYNDLRGLIVTKFLELQGKLNIDN